MDKNFYEVFPTNNNVINNVGKGNSSNSNRP
jgi:hypothetical protein